MVYTIVTGGLIPGTQDPAFSLWRPRRITSPVVLAAPHGGRNYSPDLLDAVRPSLRESGEAMLRLEDRLVDRLAMRVARATGCVLLMAHAPRAMIDLNRAPDDIDWGMVTGSDRPSRNAALGSRRSRAGLGLVPRSLSGLGEIWRKPLSSETLNNRIASIHAPYHAALAKVMDEVRERWGAVLLLDLHSMPPIGSSGSEPSAEFVIGDRFGTSAHDGISAVGLSFFSRKGRRVAHNRPYAGGYVLERHGQPRRSRHAVQLEICRTTYLDAALREESARAGAIARLLAELVTHLADETVALGQPDGLAKAAE